MKLNLAKEQGLMNIVFQNQKNKEFDDE